MQGPDLMQPALLIATPTKNAFSSKPHSVELSHSAGLDPRVVLRSKCACPSNATEVCLSALIGQSSCCRCQHDTAMWCRRQQALHTVQEELEAQCSLTMDATQRADAAEQDLSDFRLVCTGASDSPRGCA